MNPYIVKVVKDNKIFWRYKGKLYPDYLKHGNAMQWCLDNAKQYCQGRGLDIGCKHWPYPGAIPIENNKECNAYDLSSFADESMDYIFSSHCMEHLEYPDEALVEWYKKLKIGGILYLYLPHRDMEIWHPDTPGTNHGHKWIPTFAEVERKLNRLEMKIIAGSDERDYGWSFKVVSEK